MARSLKARALQWLAQREHSRAELRRKLLALALAQDGDRVEAPGAEPEQAAATVDALLDWLEAAHYLSNERFVESRLHARAARFGNRRIRDELKQHQLTLSPEAARALAEGELERALGVRARKFADWPADRAEHARQARFLAGRGFSPETITRALRRPAASEPASDGGSDVEPAGRV